MGVLSSPHTTPAVGFCNPCHPSGGNTCCQFWATMASLLDHLLSTPLLLCVIYAFSFVPLPRTFPLPPTTFTTTRRWAFMQPLYALTLCGLLIAYSGKWVLLLPPTIGSLVTRAVPHRDCCFSPTHSRLPHASCSNAFTLYKDLFLVRWFVNSSTSSPTSPW